MNNNTEQNIFYLLLFLLWLLALYINWKLAIGLIIILQLSNISSHLEEIKEKLK